MLEQKHVGNITVVKLMMSNLDTSVAADVREELSAIVSKAKGVILLNLHEVTFMDSSGLAAIVYCFKMTEMKDQLIICEISDRVRSVFKLTKLDAVLKIFDTEQSALAELGG